MKRNHLRSCVSDRFSFFFAAIQQEADGGKSSAQPNNSCSDSTLDKA